MPPKITDSSTKRQDASNPPEWTRAADIGDSYIWSEPEWHIPSDNRTYYAMSGEGRSANGWSTV